MLGKGIGNKSQQQQQKEDEEGAGPVWQNPRAAAAVAAFCRETRKKASVASVK